MRDIYKKYHKADKVPEEVYNELHTDFLVPLNLKIDDEAEDSFNCAMKLFTFGAITDLN